MQLYRQRASVRRFKPQPLQDGDLEDLLLAAQRAPTDATAQMYSLLRVVNPELRQQIATLSNNNTHVATAAEFFLVLADVHRLQQLVEHRGAVWGNWPRTAAHFATVDAVLAASALATAAEAKGYGICWIGGVLNAIGPISELCALPTGVFPVAGLCVGVPDESPAPRPRLPQRLVVHQDRYQPAQAADLDQAYAQMAPITRSGDWFKVLERYFAQDGIMPEREGRFQELLARQGFDPDLPAQLLQALSQHGPTPPSMGTLIEQILAKGYRSVLFRQGEVWLEAEPYAYRGEGPPAQALLKAVLESHGDGFNFPGLRKPG